jgi:hypothetical protein
LLATPVIDAAKELIRRSHLEHLVVDQGHVCHVRHVLTCSKIACHYMAAGRALATPCPALATDRGMGDPINDRPQRYHAHTDPSPALSGSVVALARTALALLGSRAAAAAEPVGTDPVLALWRHYNDLLRQQDPVSDSATAVRAVLACRWRPHWPGCEGRSSLRSACGPRIRTISTTANITRTPRWRCCMTPIGCPRSKVRADHADHPPLDAVRRRRDSCCGYAYCPNHTRPRRRVAGAATDLPREHAIVTAWNAEAVDEDIGEPAHDRWWESVEAMTDIAATSPLGLRAKAEVALLAFETTGGEGGPDEDLIRSVLRDAARA